MTEDCVVCQIASRRVDSLIIYEDERVICFLDVDPITVGHVLICPKVHVQDLMDLPNDLISEIFILAKAVASMFWVVFEVDGVSMIQNNGGFNELGHFHLHVFPRKFNDGFAWTRSREAVGASWDGEAVQRRLSSALRSSWESRADSS
ncbi:HIT family protein [Stenotrophomonas maltophilia]